MSESDLDKSIQALDFLFEISKCYQSIPKCQEVSKKEISEYNRKFFPSKKGTVPSFSQYVEKKIFLQKDKENDATKIFPVSGKDIGVTKWRDSAESIHRVLSLYNSKSTWSVLRNLFIFIKTRYPGLFYKQSAESMKVNGIHISELLGMTYYNNRDGMYPRPIYSSSMCDVKRLLCLNSSRVQNTALVCLKPPSVVNKIISGRESVDLKKVVDIYRDLEKQMTYLRYRMENFERCFCISYFLFKCIENMRQKGFCKTIIEKNNRNSSVYHDVVDTQNISFWINLLLQQDLNRELAVFPEFMNFVKKHEYLLLEQISTHCLPLFVYTASASRNTKLYQQTNTGPWPFSEIADPETILGWKHEMDLARNETYSLLYGSTFYGRNIHSSWKQIRPISVNMLMRILQTQGCFLEIRRLHTAFGIYKDPDRISKNPSEFVCIEFDRAHTSCFDLYYTLNRLRVMLYDLSGVCEQQEEYDSFHYRTSERNPSDYFSHYTRKHVIHIGKCLFTETMVLSGSRRSGKLYLVLRPQLLALCRHLAIGDMTQWNSRNAKISIPVFPLLVRNACYNPRVISDPEYTTNIKGINYDVDKDTELGVDPDMADLMKKTATNWGVFHERMSDQALVRALMNYTVHSKSGSRNGSIMSLRTADTSMYAEYFPYIISLFGTTTEELKKSVAEAEKTLDDICEYANKKSIDPSNTKKMPSSHYRHIYAVILSFLSVNMVHYIDSTSLNLLYKIMSRLDAETREYMKSLWYIVWSYHEAQTGQRKRISGKNPVALCRANKKDKISTREYASSEKNKRKEELEEKIETFDLTDSELEEEEEEDIHIGKGYGSYTNSIHKFHEKKRKEFISKQKEESKLGESEKIRMKDMRNCHNKSMLDNNMFSTLNASGVGNTSCSQPCLNNDDRHKDRNLSASWNEQKFIYKVNMMNNIHYLTKPLLNKNKKTAEKWKEDDMYMDGIEPSEVITSLYNLLFFMPDGVIDFDKEAERLEFNGDGCALKREIISGLFIWPCYASDKQPCQNATASSSPLKQFYWPTHIERSAKWYNSNIQRKLTENYWESMHATLDQLCNGWMETSRNNKEFSSKKEQDEYKEFLAEYKHQFEYVPRTAPRDSDERLERYNFIKSILVYLQQTEWMSHFERTEKSTSDLMEIVDKQKTSSDTAKYLHKSLCAKNKKTPSRQECTSGTKYSNPMEKVEVDEMLEIPVEKIRNMSLCVHYDTNTRKIITSSLTQGKTKKGQNIYGLVHNSLSDQENFDKKHTEVFEGNGFPIFTPIGKDKRSDPEYMEKLDFLIHTGSITSWNLPSYFTDDKTLQSLDDVNHFVKNTKENYVRLLTLLEQEEENQSCEAKKKIQDESYAQTTVVQKDNRNDSMHLRNEFPPENPLKQQRKQIHVGSKRKKDQVQQPVLENNAYGSTETLTKKGGAQEKDNQFLDLTKLSICANIDKFISKNHSLAKRYTFYKSRFLSSRQGIHRDAKTKKKPPVGQEYATIEHCEHGQYPYTSFGNTGVLPRGPCVEKPPISYATHQNSNAKNEIDYGFDLFN